MIKKSLRLFSFLVVAFAASLSAPSFAALASVAVVPTGWRLQNYVPNGVVVYFTGVTTCGGAAQALTLDSSATADDRNRLWTAIMTGKTASKYVFVYYDSATCVISSFGLLENG